MNYGMYISTSGALNASYRQDLHAGNLANLNTVGYKPDIATTRQRDAARLEDGLGHLPSNSLLERLGAGVMAAPTRADFSQGTIKPTGNSLDLAVRGEGFFTLIDRSGSDGAQLRLTRDGRFTRAADGTIVSVTGGLPLAGDNGGPIRLTSNAPVTIEPDGTIRQDGAVSGRIALTEVPGRDSLRKGPAGTFLATAAQTAGRSRASGQIVQHAVEESGVNEIAALMKIQSASRSAQANLGMIGYHDQLMNQAINRFARTA